ncbi:Dehydration-responsive element-binding protein 1F [Glycine soja]|uniref:Dehydration-responsive element-binding protein 1F n=1 Tax=Glycine soja TaxID=3848 RepID=A0A445HN16_GLYSO|nr:Dehydration-responsive element-binding protein 1F [Glycine soja]
MDFEIINESPDSTSLSSPSSLSPCTPPNSNPLSDSPNPQPSNIYTNPSHKRKAGRKKFRETRHPVYRGVRQRNRNKWVCEIREPIKKSRIWVGTYPTPEMAARAHDVAVLALSGTSANFNFPDSVSLLPLAKSRSAVDIREAAKATTTAEAFIPNTVFACSHKNAEDTCLNIGMHDDGSEMFFDEEAVYNMPGLLDSMAEGLLITPPSMKRAMDWDDIGCDDTVLHVKLMQPASSNGESSLDAPLGSGFTSINGELALNNGVARCSGDIAMHSPVKVAI